MTGEEAPAEEAEEAKKPAFDGKALLGKIKEKLVRKPRREKPELNLSQEAPAEEAPAAEEEEVPAEEKTEE